MMLFILISIVITSMALMLAITEGDTHFAVFFGCSVVLCVVSALYHA